MQRSKSIVVSCVRIDREAYKYLRKNTQKYTFGVFIRLAPPYALKKAFNNEINDFRSLAVNFVRFGAGSLF